MRGEPGRARFTRPWSLPRATGTPVDYQQLLVQHLALVDRLVQFVARRHRLSVNDAEEFGSVVRYKLVESNFAILRKFEGRSSLGTYLTIVIERLCLDFCVAKWGKWRPSALARRIGPVALLLEQLVHRDGVTFDEAVGTLQTNHGVSESREQLHAIYLQLPPRAPRGLSVDHAGRDAALAAEADSIDQVDDRAAFARVEAALAAAVATLNDEDRLILKLRFEDSRTVTQIAALLRLPAKPLYRRLERIMATLRVELERRGIDEQTIVGVIGHPALSLAGVLAQPARPL